MPRHRILFVQYTNPACYPPLMHAARILADSGWHVDVLGAHVAGVEGVQEIGFPQHPRICVRNLERTPTGWRQRVRYVLYALWVVLSIPVIRPTWVYASDGWSYPIALLVSVLFRVRVVMHEHDTPLVTGTTWLRFVGWARRQLAGRAVLCVIPQADRALQFQTDHPACRVSVVWNCPRREEAQTRTPREDQQLILVYSGTIVPARLPLSIISAVAAHPAIRLRILGYVTIGARGYDSTLMRAAVKARISDRVEILTPRSRDAMFEVLRQCDIGLALMPTHSEDANLVSMVGASNKVFDYLAVGLPVVVSDLPSWRAFAVVPGYGRAVNPEDPGSVAETLEWFIDHPIEARAMGEAGRQRIITDWNYETQFEPVKRRLTE